MKNGKNIFERWYLTPLDDKRIKEYEHFSRPYEEYLSPYIGRLSGFCLVNNIIPIGDPFYDMLKEIEMWYKEN